MILNYVLCPSDWLEQPSVYSRKGRDMSYMENLSKSLHEEGIAGGPGEDELPEFRGHLSSFQ